MSKRKIRSGMFLARSLFFLCLLFVLTPVVNAEELSLQDSMLKMSDCGCPRHIQPAAEKYLFPHHQDFAIHLEDKILSPSTLEKISENGDEAMTHFDKHYEIKYRSLEPPLTIKVVYNLDPCFYRPLWKHFEIETAPGQKVLIKKIELARFKPWTEPKIFAGLGQPVYVGDTFWTIRYPASLCSLRDGLVICEYKLGLEVEGTLLTHPLIYGISEPGNSKQDFLNLIGGRAACLETDENGKRYDIRRQEPFLLYNTWYDLFNFTDQEVIASIQGFKKQLVDPYNIKIDSVVLDDGWDDWSELWRPHRKRFPHGFAPVAQEAETIGAKLGLWMSPIGGYAVNHDRRLWGTLGQGYEKNLNNFCFAGTNYNRTFIERMVEYEKTFGVNYFKLDNLSAVCGLPGHGHRTGEYAREGLTDSFISVLEKAREANPEVMINFTVGSWLSPWWLTYADVLWRGGMDFGFAGEGSLRQRNITYVDQALYQRLRVEEAQFPISALMTHGIIKGKRQSFGETGENLRDFSDDVWMYFTRGVMMAELYLSPELVSDREWEVLAQAIRFWREHDRLLLDHGEMVLGDPDRGEVYGFYHEQGDESLLTLRNPAFASASFPGQVMETYLWDSREPIHVSKVRLMRTCFAIYSSSGSGLSDPLPAFEVRVIYCRPGNH